MERVVINKCNTYSKKELQSGIKEIFKLLGGIDKYINPGDTVLLKVNLLMGKSPELAITTHPDFVREIALFLKESGARVVIGDSPGGRFTENNLKKIYNKSGMTDISQKLDIDLNFNTESEKVSFTDGKIKKAFNVSRFALEADCIVNLPKLKTHNLTVYTGAVKNLFGVIPGLLKGEYHLKTPDIETFSDMLIDLALKINPVLNIMDAVEGMEGEGPSDGDVQKFGYIMASPSSLALDTAGTYLMGIKPQTKVPLLDAAKKRNLPYSYENMEKLGDLLSPVTDTRIPSAEKNSNLLDTRLPRPLGRMADYLLKPKPYFNDNECTLCGKCVENCPADVLSINTGGSPDLEINNCIRCFCCQELCEYNAVEIKRPLLGKLLFSR